MMGLDERWKGFGNQTMTYIELVKKIENMRRFGKASGYEVSTQLLKALDYPEKGMDVIHIAGTNGKGSTAAFLSSILKEAGKKVGLFTSPHLVTFRERIQINGELISEEDVLRLGQKVLEAESYMPLDATMFDITLAIALLYFKEQKVDVVVLETGLGGAKDSTRALCHPPKVAVITNIGFDHTQVLGNTLTEIAENKAGIIRPGCFTVIANMAEEAKAVLESTCQSLCVPYGFSKDVTLEDGISLGLLGEYQKENAQNSVLAAGVYLNGSAFSYELKELEDGDFSKLLDETKKRAFLNGLKNARHPGRMEILSKDPFVMVDGAHNPQGVSALSKSLVALYPGEKFVFVVGVLADKDYGHMMEEMLPIAEEFVTVTVESERALQGEELAGYLRDKGAKATSASSIDEAFSEKRNGKTVVFGSLYFVGDVIQYFKVRNTVE